MYNRVNGVPFLIRGGVSTVVTRHACLKGHEVVEKATI